MSRICTKCNQDREEEYYPSPLIVRRKNGSVYKKRRPQCKDCVNKHKRIMNARKNPADSFEVGGYRRSRRRLWETHRMTEDEYTAMYDSQQGVCAICKKAQARVVDHNHSTGKVRALLCQHCNVMIGTSLESVYTLEQGIKYIKKHNDVRSW